MFKQFSRNFLFFQSLKKKGEKFKEILLFIFLKIQFSF